MEYWEEINFEIILLSSEYYVCNGCAEYTFLGRANASF